MEPVPSWPLTHAVALPVWPELQTSEPDTLLMYPKKFFIEPANKILKEFF